VPKTDQRDAVRRAPKSRIPIVIAAKRKVGRIARQLSFLQLCFVRRYIATHDLAKAAQAAGFRASECDLKKEGKLLYTDPLIRRAIDEERANILASLEVDAIQIERELTKIAMANLVDYTEANEGGDLILRLADVPYEKMAAVQELTVDERTSERFDKEGNVLSSITTRKPKIKLYDKRAALMDLARIKGMLADEDKESESITINVIGGLPDRDTRDVGE
jgi:phage terminase small subunit